MFVDHLLLMAPLVPYPWSFQARHPMHAPTYPRHTVIREAHHHFASASPKLNLGAQFPEERSTGRGSSNNHQSRFTGQIGTHPLESRAKSNNSSGSSHGSSHGRAQSGHAHAVPAHRDYKIQHRHYEQDPLDHHDHHRHQCDDEYCSDHDESHIHYSDGASRTKPSRPIKDDFHVSWALNQTHFSPCFLSRR
jgi:hypothetical protein